MEPDPIKMLTAVEDAFGFSIPEEDADGLDTVGRLYEYVLAHRFHGKRQACLRSVTFYKMRRAMMSVLEVERGDVRAATELSAIIPKHRRRVWHALQETAGFRLPRLRCAAWVRSATILATIGMAVAVPMLLSLSFFNGAILVGILTALAVGYAFSWLTVPLAFEFHPECPTAGQLATATLARNYRAIVGASDITTTDAEVWQTVCSIVAEQLGGRADDLAEDTPLDKELAIVGSDKQRGWDVDQSWVTTGLPCGQNAELPLHYAVEHQ